MELRDGIIICENSIKNQILKSKHSSELSYEIYNYKFMNLNSLIEELTIKVKKEGILFLSKKLNISPKTALEYIKYLKYLDGANIDKIKPEIIKSAASKLDKLRNIYDLLNSNGYITTNTSFLNYLKKSFVTFVGYELSELKYVIDILEKEKVTYDIKSNKPKEKEKITIYEFERLEDESRFVFNNIKKLLDRGTDINKIKICNFSSDYLFSFKRLSNYYKISFNFEKDKNILSSKIAKTLFSKLKKYNDFKELVNSLKEDVEKGDIDINNSAYVNKIINIINSYNLTNYKPSDTLDIFKMELAKISYDNEYYDNAIEFVDAYKYEFCDDEYIFFIGFNSKTVPHIIQDNGYLGNDILEKLGLETNLQKNVRNKKRILDIINKCENIIITYSSRSAFNTYTHPSFINHPKYEIIIPLEGKRKVFDISKDKFVSFDDVSVYDSLLCVNKLEDVINYCEHIDDNRRFNIEKDNYQDIKFETDYMSFDNSFKGISDELLGKYLPEVIKLSYSTMKTYYACKFKYYLDNILRIEPESDKYYMNQGSYAHKILEDSYNDDFDLEKEKKIALDEVYKGEITDKERFFLKFFDKLIEELIAFNKEHEEKSLFFEDKTKKVNLLTEREDHISLCDGKLIFKGTIDKTLFDKCLLNEEDPDSLITYVCIIDYKTGKDEIDLANVEYGFNAQLPLYVYLLKNGEYFKEHIKSPKLIGFYLQRLNLSERNFALEGYSTLEKDLLSSFDSDFESGEYIKNLKINANGAFSSSSRIFDDEYEKKLYEISEKLILEGYKGIRKGSFEINPKKQGSADLSCKYCKYKNICFKKYKDIQVLEKPKLVVINSKPDKKSIKTGGKKGGNK